MPSYPLPVVRSRVLVPTSAPPLFYDNFHRVDGSIINNTKHGILSTNPSNSIDDFLLEAN